MEPNRISITDYFDFLDADDIRIRGTRVGIETVLDDYMNAYSPEEIAVRYPTLTLEQVYAVRELAALENPSAPFTVSLWIDEPGKTQFKSGDRVTLFYKVTDLPQNSKAWLTLINIAPDGLSFKSDKSE